MARVFHLVGWGGSRKTTIACALATNFARTGHTSSIRLDTGCPGMFNPALDDFEYFEDVDIMKADYVFLEHFPRDFSGGNPGDLVIRLEWVPKPAQVQPILIPIATENVAESGVKGLNHGC